VHIEDVKEMIYCVSVEKRIALMIWGRPGIGKSEAVKQVCVECAQDTKRFPGGFGCVDLRLPQLDPTDLRGIPVPDKEEGICKWYPPSFLPRDGHGPDHGILFLDEIEKAPTSVKNASLQLVLDRRVGDYVLPSGWSIVAAGNREEDGAFSQPLGSALQNRMAHIDAEVDTDVWLAWAHENRLMEDIIGYIAWRKDHLYPEAKDAEGGGRATIVAEKAFPSPRSWHMASIGIESAASERQQYKIISACVGREMCGEFRNWHKIFRRVDPRRIIEDGKIPREMEKKEQSYKYAVTMACAFYTRKNSIVKSEHARKNLQKFLSAVGKELSIVFWRNIETKDAIRLSRCSEFGAFVKDIIQIAKPKRD
jgi:hypothetical protein